MAIPKPTAAITRVRQANNNAYEASTNPGGLAEGGHRPNFVPNLGANADIALWTESMAADVEITAEQVAQKAQEVDDAAEAAQTAADQSQEGAARLVGTSTTSLTASVGDKTLTTQAGKAFGVGSRVSLTNTAARVMYGTVTAYNDTSMTVAVDRVVGSGTAAEWTIRLAGLTGDKGDKGDEAPAAPLDGLGYNQSWQSVSRGIDTIYQNTTGRPIALVVAAGNDTGRLTVRVSPTTNMNVSVASLFANTSAFVVIPNNHYYQISVLIAPQTISFTRELR